mmetsp:Transcript_63809/g.181213  ORF Transcript_63809/g.181213 Transcript_63809/m.181213 type:complete len:399 (-) Transcript_63809:774-1970(-)
MNPPATPRLRCLLHLHVLDGGQANCCLYVLVHGADNVGEVRERHLQVGRVRRARGLRCDDALEEEPAVLQGHVADHAVLLQRLRHAVSAHVNNSAGRDALRFADVNPLRPQCGLTDPVALRHMAGGQRVHRRCVGLLVILDGAMHKQVGLVGRRPRHKQVVAGAQEDEVDEAEARAQAMHHGGICRGPESEQPVRVEVVVEDLEAELGAQGGRKQHEGLHVLLAQPVLLALPLSRLPLHADGDPPAHVVLAQELAQPPEAHVVLLHHHLILDHGRRQRRHQPAAEEQTNQQAEDVEYALRRVGARYLDRTQCDLGHRPVKRSHVLVHPTSLNEWQLDVLRGGDRVRPPHAGIGRAQAPYEDPHAGHPVAQPQGEAEEKADPHGHAPCLGEVLFRVLLE